MRTISSAPMTPSQSVGTPTYLSPLNKHHAGDYAAQQVAVRARRQQRPDDDHRHASDHDRTGESQLYVTEQQCSEGGREREREGLGQVGADELLVAQSRIDHNQQHQDQGAGADRGESHHEPADDADEDRRHGPHLDVLVTRGRGLDEDRAIEDGDRADDERRAEQYLQAMLGHRALAQEMHHVGAQERRRDRAVTEVAHDRAVDGLATPVDEDAGRLHEEGGHEVRGDRGRRRDAEEEYQHGRHQRAAAHAGQTDEEADHGTTHDEVDVNVHATSPSVLYLVKK